MREVPDSLTEAFHGRHMIGDRRPMARVTVQDGNMRLHNTPENVFANFIFPQEQYRTPSEMRRVKSVSWERDIDQPAASCTVVLTNVRAVPPDETPEPGVLDDPGYFTYNRGTSGYTALPKNGYEGMLMPDNILRTYEGYGWDFDVPPEEDPFLVQTGTWKIDRVVYNADGTITIECRDMIALLMDQMAYLPVVPKRAGFVNKDVPDGAYSYPLSFSALNSEPTIRDVPLDPQRIPLTYRSSSNAPYYGSSPVYGHSPHHAFDDDEATFWLSVGNSRPDQGYSFEWIEGSIPKQTVRQVKFRTFGQGYTCYLGLYVDGVGWVGDHVVPYDQNHPVSAPNGSNERYYAAMGVPVEQRGPDYWTFNLGEGVKNVTRIRLTFGGLFYSGMGPYPYRAGVRVFQAFGGPSTKREVIRHRDRNYDDYTDIVKLLCAWSGLYWPKDSAWVKSTNGNARRWTYENDDKAMTIKKGRVWGDFQQTGTYGPAPLGPDIFDKKPLLAGVQHIQDIVGFLFYADELGGAVWRPPNLYEFGNTYHTLGSRAGERTTRMVQLHQDYHILGLSATLDSANIRERTFVGSANGRVAGMSKGWNPNPTGLRRVGGWTDQHFETDAECQVMAEMIALRQLFSYRQDEVVIAGFPAIQIDDQIRIFERVTGDGFVHYVKGISSSHDLETGEWTYTLKTHWLGERPPTPRPTGTRYMTPARSSWIFDVGMIADPAARRMIQAAHELIEPGEGTLV